MNKIPKKYHSIIRKLIKKAYLQGREDERKEKKK